MILSYELTIIIFSIFFIILILYMAKNIKIKIIEYNIVVNGSNKTWDMEIKNGANDKITL